MYLTAMLVITKVVKATMPIKTIRLVTGSVINVNVRCVGLQETENLLSRICFKIFFAHSSNPISHIIFSILFAWSLYTEFFETGGLFQMRHG